MLPALSAILNSCDSGRQATLAALAVQGIYALCQAEVIDIQTTWAVLSGKLNKEARSLVLVELCALFSLLPELTVETPEFKEFESDIVSKLWTYTSHADTAVAKAAFSALAKFTSDRFQLQHLPSDVTAMSRDALMRSAESYSADDVDQAAVSGDCYITLMKRIPEDVLPAYQTFLTTLIEQEISSLPKHVYHSARQQQQSAVSRDKMTQSIPGLLKSKHDTNKQPALRPYMAVGMLLSYAPAIECGNDGRVGKVAVARHGRVYHQTLYTLINEVAVPTGEWLCALTMPHAWAAYMQRCFHAYVDSRRAELELELERGRVNDLEEHELKMKSAWLWAREKLLDLIKSLSKGGTPAAQANCLYALVGLTLVLNTYTSAMSAATLRTLASEAPEFITHRHWLNTALHTVLCILNPSHEPQARPWPIGGQRSGGEMGLAAGTISRSAAAYSMQLLVPVLLSAAPDLVIPCLHVLQGSIHNGNAETTSHGIGMDPALDTAYATGLGTMLAALIQENYTEVAGTDGMVAVWQAMDVLEKHCFGDFDNNLGSVLGVAICTGALCDDGKTDSRVHVAAVLNKFSVHMDNVVVTPELWTHQAMCLAIAAISAGAYQCNIIDQDTVNKHVARLYELYMQDTASYHICVSLGLLFDSLLQAGHPSVGELSQTVCETWTQTVGDETASWMSRVAGLGGLMSMAGINKTWLPMSSSSGSVETGNREILRLANGILGATDCDVKLQGGFAWMLGALFASTGTSKESSSNLPASYKYLGSASVVCPLVEQLVTWGKKPMSNQDLSHIRLLLRSLAAGPKQPLPPLNW